MIKSIIEERWRCNVNTDNKKGRKNMGVSKNNKKNPMICG
jgi:hypothetical protein